MQELVKTMVSGLVDHPVDIEIEETSNNGIVDLQLFVHPDDMGKVIGKQGRIANSIRQILKACAIKENVKVNLEIASRDE